MESIDQAQATRVWQRVKGTGTLREQSLAELIRGEWEDAAVLFELSRRLRGREAQTLQRLCDQERAHARRLKGVFVMGGGEMERLERQAVEGKTLELLRRCYGRMRQRLGDYESMSREGEFAPVYAQLAREERLSCCQVAELIGILTGK